MSAPTNPIGDEGTGKISPNKGVEPQGPSKATPGGDFQSHMNQGKATSASTSQAQPSPMEIAASGQARTDSAGISMNSLIGQAKHAQDSFGEVSKQLNTPNLKLKRSQSHLLRNKLSDANAQLNSVSEKLGVPPAKVNTKGTAGPFGRFVAYVNAGQEQFAAVQSKLSELAAKGQQLNPADMMLLQSKMNIAQQEIEYSSTLLGKVIESIKTMMNIQL